MMHFLLLIHRISAILYMEQLISEKERYNFIDTTNILSDVRVTEGSLPITHSNTVVARQIFR